MDTVKQQDSRRLMKAEIAAKRLPEYKVCPKCNRRNEFRVKKETRTHPVNYKGTHTCRVCKKESTIAEWLELDLDK